MKPISTFALAASLAAGAGLLAAPAAAQLTRTTNDGKSGKQEEKAKKQDNKGISVKLGERTLTIGAQARQPLAELQAAVTAKDAANFPAKLAAAQAAAQTADEKYLVARLQLDYARGASDAAGTNAAMEAMIQSGGAPADELAALYSSVGEAAFNAGQFDKAGNAFEQLSKLQPNNAEVVSNLSVVRGRQGRTAEAAQLLARATEMKSAGGQAVPEDYYKRIIDQAYKSKDVALANKTLYTWLNAYPTEKNWSDALQTHRALVPLDDAAELDRFRLMRVAGALKSGDSYTDLAAYLLQKGLPGEAKAVLEDGAGKGVLSRGNAEYSRLLTQATQRATADRPTLAASEGKAGSAANGRIAANTGDAYMGYGDYAKAVAMYRLALQKGGVDAALVNTRLGMALAMSGDKAGAKTALAAVTGPRAELARYWLLWLDKRA
jgi:tetratricopeptide (TPR) repeat protein